MPNISQAELITLYTEILKRFGTSAITSIDNSFDREKVGIEVCFSYTQTRYSFFGTFSEVLELITQY